MCGVERVYVCISKGVQTVYQEPDNRHGGLW